MTIARREKVKIGTRTYDVCEPTCGDMSAYDQAKGSNVDKWVALLGCCVRYRGRRVGAKGVRALPFTALKPLMKAHARIAGLPRPRRRRR